MINLIKKAISACTNEAMTFSKFQKAFKPKEKQFKCNLNKSQVELLTACFYFGIYKSEDLEGLVKNYSDYKRMVK